MRLTPPDYQTTRMAVFALTGGVVGHTLADLSLWALGARFPPWTLAVSAAMAGAVLLANWALHQWALARMDMARHHFEMELQRLTIAVIEQKFRDGDIELMTMRVRGEDDDAADAAPGPKAH